VLDVPAALRFRGRELSPFRWCGLLGLAAACAVAIGTSAARGLSIPAEIALILTAILVFLALAIATRAVTGREALIYYHHEIAVLATVAAVAAALGLRVLPHLDATALGLGAFLSLGRLGCLLAGCCHGRPAPRGVRYGAAHVEHGFPGYLAGIVLLPVQAIEAVGVAGLVFGGALAVPHTPGAAFGFYVTGYAVLRFGLERLRGDPIRRYWRGLSEAQWTSLAVVAAMGALAAVGLIPGLPEHLLAAGALAVAALVTWGRPPRLMLDPRHVRELAVRLPGPRPGAPRLVATSLGVRVSAGVADDLSHFAVSRAECPLTREQAGELGRVLAWLAGARGEVRVIDGAAGVHHILMAPTGAA
jgi:hypothetical protein